MIATTPRSSKRRASSTTPTSVVSAQPSIATRPSRASTPTAIAAGCSDAAAKLDLQVDAAADRPHRRAIDRVPDESAVEIDDVQPWEARIGKLPGLCRGIVVEYRCARHLPANEANAGAILQIDGWVEDHGAAGSSSRSL